MSKITEKWGLYQRFFKGEPEMGDQEALLADIAAKGHMHKSTYVVGDPYQTAFNEGARHLALSIFRFLERDPKKLEEMINKAIAAKENNSYE